MKITVTSDLVGERLDKFLTKHCPDLSRSEIQKLIKNGRVEVNGSAATPGRRLKREETVEIPAKRELKKEEEQEFKKQKKESPRPEIIAETEDYVVVNKPAGLISHRAPHIKKPSLTDFLVEKYPEMDEVGEDEWRPGLLHRLDREVSGLVVAARNQESFYDLKKQFQARKVKKEYTALVHGVPQKDEGEIDLPISRSSRGFKMAAGPKGSLSVDGAREARTRFSVITTRKSFSLLKVRIFTGRTHQIRTHLAALGHPVVGDDLYGHKKTKSRDRRVREQGFLKNRIFLVADVLAFRDLNKEIKEFSLDLPPELEEFWESLLK